jgi:hypothetical protein
LAAIFDRVRESADFMPLWQVRKRKKKKKELLAGFNLKS